METLHPEILKENFAAYIGFDWGDKEHVYRILDPESKVIKEHTLLQNSNALERWVIDLQKRYPKQRVAIAIEQSKGAVINFLMGYDFFEVFIVNPKLAARYRQAFKSSGAKDDGNDSGFILDILLKHPDRLKLLKPEDNNTRALQILTEKRRDAIRERTRFSNQLKAILKQYYPLALEVAGDNLHTVMACNFLLRWPTFDKLKRARKTTIHKFYTEHSCRSTRVIENRIREIKQAKPLTTDPVIIETAVLEVKMLSEQLLSLISHIEKYDREINKIFPKHPDAEIYSSLPGAGPALAPRLLAALGTDRNRFQTPAEVQNYTGIAPVTVQSGKKRLVRWRWACPKFIRQSFHEFAGESRRHSIWASAYYNKQREAGRSHNAAVRSLAYKWLRIIYRCWQDHKVYDELIYINALKKNNSDLFNYVV